MSTEIFSKLEIPHTIAAGPGPGNTDPRVLAAFSNAGVADHMQPDVLRGMTEAKKMLRERKLLIEKKGKITLQTGYGPSGLPHIGTFGEVARTSMMVNALKQLTDFPTEIITFWGKVN